MLTNKIKQEFINTGKEIIVNIQYLESINSRVLAVSQKHIKLIILDNGIITTYGNYQQSMNSKKYVSIGLIIIE